MVGMGAHHEDRNLKQPHQALHCRFAQAVEEAPVPMQAEHHQLGLVRGGGVRNHLKRIAKLDGAAHRRAGLRDRGDEALEFGQGVTAPFFGNRCGQLPVDHMQNMALPRGLRCQPDRPAHGAIGAFGKVAGDENGLHLCLLSSQE